MIDMKQINDHWMKIVHQFNPQKILLFGSYGTPGPDSDVDLLVVLHFEGKSAIKSVEILNKPDPILNAFRPKFRMLSSYAIQFRYPGESEDRNIAKQAVNITSSFHDMIRLRLELSE